MALLQSEFETQQVTLDLSTAGLGFSIVGGTDEPLPDGSSSIAMLLNNKPDIAFAGSTAISVSSILPRGAAYLAGLKTNDRIISVENISLKDVSHAFAVDTVKNAIPNRVSIA